MYLTARINRGSTATSAGNACGVSSLHNNVQAQNKRSKVSAYVTKPEVGQVEARLASKPAVAPHPPRRQAVTEELVNDHKTLYKSLLKEYDYWVDGSWVTGTIPKELCGTYYRNGSGLLVENPRYSRHVFDGDGMVFSLAFKDGRVFFRNRFVRTEGFLQEQAAGKPLYRTSFSKGSADGSLLFNPFDLTFKNVANTTVLPWAGQLLAMYEGGLPHSMDPATLDTLGITTFGGAIKEGRLAAHYRIVEPPRQQWGAAAAAPEGRRFVGFGTSQSVGSSAVTFYEFGEDGTLLHETPHKLEGTAIPFIHDLAVTEHYYLLVLGPVDLDLRKFATSYLFSRCSIAECLTFDRTKPAKVVMVPRPGRPSGKALPTRVLEAPPCFTFHHCNAFEVERPARSSSSGSSSGGGGEPLVVLDTVALDDLSFSVNQYNYNADLYQGGQRSHLTRFVCDPSSGSVTAHRLLRRTLEFPVVDPRTVGRTHTRIWAAGDIVDDTFLWGPFQALIRVDVDQRVGLEGGPSPAGGDGGGEERFSGPNGAVAGAAADIWYTGERRFVGEPMFVPRPGSSREGDGWIIAAVHDVPSQKAEIVILDAEDLSSGPLATIHLPHRLPPGLHGAWDAQFVGPEPGSAAPWFREVATVRPLL